MDKYVTLGVVTAFFLLAAIIGFVVAELFEERGVIRCCVELSCVCLYLAWLITFLMQLNPLVGPRGNRAIIYGLIAYWPNSLIHDEKDP
ncbi:hypothetical protein KR009_008430 [Drosophila setifemur]|nr:hypothetical protein KR009_008430 [Drosophila setifemur]